MKQIEGETHVHIYIPRKEGQTLSRGEEADMARTHLNGSEWCVIDYGSAATVVDTVL
jgi:hypothetical protein